MCIFVFCTLSAIQRTLSQSGGRVYFFVLFKKKCTIVVETSIEMERQKADFRSRIKKNKAGEVSVIRHKSGFRTLNVCGKVSIPSLFAKYPYILQRIVSKVGALFLGYFPFLDKRSDKRICTYTLTESVAYCRPRIYLTYDFLFTISAVDISADIILGTVLNTNSKIADLILDKLDEEMEEAYGESG